MDEIRKNFEESLKRIVAVQIPLSAREKQYIYLLFSDDIDLRNALLFAREFDSLGLSIIIEKYDEHESILKIFDIESDDFYVNDKIIIQSKVITDYANRITTNTKLSFGVFLDKSKIDYWDDYPIDLKSVSILDATQI